MRTVHSWAPHALLSPVGLSFIGLSLIGLATAASFAAERPAYPPTPQIDARYTLHGETIDDPYQWLEHDDDPNVIAWQAAQNALTRKTLDAFPTAQADFRRQLQAIYDLGVMTSPRVTLERYFYERLDPGADQPKLYLRAGRWNADPRVILNPNTLSDDGTVAIDWWQPSLDGSVLAYGLSSAGDEWSTLHLYDVRDGYASMLAIPRCRASDIAWTVDSRAFYYARYPQPGDVPAGDENYHRTIYYHKFGTDWRDDPVIFRDEQDKTTWPTVMNTADRQHVLLTVERGWTRNDLYLHSLRDQDPAMLTPVAVGLPALVTGDVLNDKLYLLTNHDAPNFRVVVAPVDTPDPAHWKELVAAQDDRVIQDMHIIGARLVLNVLENASSRLMIYDLDGRPDFELNLPALGTVSDIQGTGTGTEIFFTFESLLQPPTVYRYDISFDELTTIDAPELPYDPNAFEVKRLSATSKDGTKVPMFVALRKGAPLRGDAPTILTGYGGFNIAMTPSFSPWHVPWVQRGGVLAVACLRGGGELGTAWHEAAVREQKQHTFDDMIAAAEQLIAERYTATPHLAIAGGSNGGLLVGAVYTQRPDLIAAGYCAVPLLDMLRYHQFSIARLWISEYGSSENSNDFRALRAYSPYHNIKPGTNYPALLLTTAEEDARVAPLHARKMAASLQHATGGDAPILLRVESKAGHGAGKPTTKRVGEQTDMLTFLAWRTGMIKPE